MKRFRIQKLEEDGFASITIAIVLIIVLALTTIGFAQLARREQQSALTKQLASQANYAAESGINDVENYIRGNGPLGAIDSPNSCLPLNTIPQINGNVDTDRDAKYTCVIVDTSPPELGAQIGAFKAWQTTFTTTGVMNKLEVKWKNRDGESRTPKPSGSKTFYPTNGADKWGSAPAVLQVAITPLDSLTRDTLADKTFTEYMYPSEAPGSNTAQITTAPTISGKGQIISGNCVGDVCTGYITGLESLGNGRYFALRIVSYYDASQVTIKSYTSSNAELEFENSQAKVDVTGKSRNVLKRLQARVPIKNPSYDLPNYAIEAKNICKRIKTTPLKTEYVNVNNGSASSTSDPCYLGEN